ncbi:MAG: phosphoribosylglycinamide formyltransferase [Chloroflexota bacterium]
MSGRLVVLASGGGTNLQALINAIAAGTLDARIALVIVNRKAALARERADRVGIPCRYEPLRPWLERGQERAEYDTHLAQLIAAEEPDLLVMAGWMHICSDDFVRQFSNKIMNVHPALLPAFPGAHAISDALAYGVKVTGVTVMYVWPGGLTNYDNGPIILQAAVPVEEGDSEETLGARIHATEHRLLPEAVRLHLTGRLRVEGRRVTIA